MQYPIAIVHQNNQYFVTIPDIPSLQVIGDSVADVVADTRLTVIKHLQTLIQTDQPLPEASPVSVFLEKPEFAGCIWAIVGIELSRILGDSIEINLQLPARLYTKIGQTFPNDPLEKVVIEALKQYLNKV